jgi:uncharacterized membrane protein YqhA
MYDLISPIVYCMSVFWGYLLLRQSPKFENKLLQIFVGVLGITFLQAPWLTRHLGIQVGLLLYAVILGLILSLILNSSKVRQSFFKTMTLGEKLLWGCMPLAGFWIAIQFVMSR